MGERHHCGRTQRITGENIIVGEHGGLWEMTGGLSEAQRIMGEW